METELWPIFFIIVPLTGGAKVISWQTLGFLSKTSDVESEPIFDGRGTSNIFKLYFGACLRATKGAGQLDSGCPNSFSQTCSPLIYLHNYLSTYSFNFGVLSIILFGEKYMNNNNIFLCSKKRKKTIDYIQLFQP